MAGIPQKLGFPVARADMDFSILYPHWGNGEITKKFKKNSRELAFRQCLVGLLSSRCYSPLRETVIFGKFRRKCVTPEVWPGTDFPIL